MDKKSKVAIVVDSSCDLPNGYAEDNDIKVLNIGCSIGDEEYLNGISSVELLKKVREKNVMPKTFAITGVEFEECFEGLLKEYDEVVSFSISSGASSTYNNAEQASKKFEGKVFCVDTKSLSGGIGLMVMKAVKLRNEGYGAEYIKDEIISIRDNINMSFVVDTMDFLYKGGRCASMQYYGAKILKIHPSIAMVDGKLKSDGKYFGNVLKCMVKYAEDLKKKYPNYDDSVCLITHSPMDSESVQKITEKVRELFIFKEIYDVDASSTITCHCGENTLGVLFIFR